MGLCSYLLIGFYFDKKFATNAGNKAFIVNRIGDFGFSLAMFYIFKNFGSLDFDKVFHQAASAPEVGADDDRPAADGGRLRQVRADSAVRLAARRDGRPHAGFGADPRRHHGDGGRLHDGAVVGDFHACSGRDGRDRDHRRRDGVVCGHHRPGAERYQESLRVLHGFAARLHVHRHRLGRISAGIYHLMTHAFFKALLFLGAGSVIHALSGEQDMRQHGRPAQEDSDHFLDDGLRLGGDRGRPSVLTASSVRTRSWRPPTSTRTLIYWIGVFTAGLTAFYVSRAMFMTFFGSYRGQAHPHESPAVMWVPLAVLAVLSLAGGWLFPIPEFLKAMFPAFEEATNPLLTYISVFAGLAGIGLAYLIYMVKPGMADALAQTFRAPYQLFYNKYFVDELYDTTVVRPLVGGSRMVLWKGVDAGLIDGIVNGMGARCRGCGQRAAALAIRQYTQLRDLGAVRSVALILAMGLFGGLPR